MKHYRSIEELPIWNFQKANETSDLRYILKLKDYFDLPPKDTKKLIPVFDTILEELFEKFGFDESFLSAMAEEKAILILKLKMIAGDRSLDAIIKIKEKNLIDRSALESKVKMEFEKRVAVLESHFKIPFDVHKMSVSRFYTYTSLFSDYVKKIPVNYKKVL